MDEKRVAAWHSKSALCFPPLGSVFDFKPQSLI